jgi:hypothetical protein
MPLVGIEPAIPVRQRKQTHASDHRNIYLTTLNTHKKQTFMPLVGFKTAIPVRQQTHASDHLATGASIIKHRHEYTGYKNHHIRNKNGKIHQN